MKPKKERVDELRAYLKSLTEDQRKEIADNLGYHNIEGHIFSGRNQVLLSFQTMGDNSVQGTFGGFKQWIKAGRFVRKGEHGHLIMFPSSQKIEKENGEADELKRFYFASVFDISQTDELQAEGA